VTAHIASTVAGDVTRRRLIHATARILSRKGYSQTRLQEIAEAADLKAPAVYYHFASRDALVCAALREGQILVRDHVVAALEELPATASSRTRVLSAVAAHLRIELELSDLATAVVRTAGHVPHHIRTEIQPEIDAYHDLWRGLLETAHADGALRPGMDRSVARMLVLGCLNWAAEWASPPIPPDLVSRDACSLVEHALFSGDEPVSNLC
jgi:TetR/AcrR family transcriptional regulator, cholesterol catabolism regulator